MKLEVDRLEKALAHMAVLDGEARSRGYNLNPDESMTLPLCDGLLVNQARYGYQSCPCRLAAGNREDDLDIVCPCDYRDDDLAEYGACYCGLYVSDDVVAGRRKVASIPERRPDPRERDTVKPADPARAANAKRAVWRCRVCGYLCAMDHPPGKCPICGAEADRFEPFPM